MTPAEREHIMLLTVSVMKAADLETRHMLAESLGALRREDVELALKAERENVENGR